MAVNASTSVVSSPVAGAIRKAAQATGTSFDYLLATAKVESDLDPGLAMRSSTATGLFQFIEQTWLETLKQGGPAFGLGSYADAISRTASGRYVVSDPKLRDEIMQLRKDPIANALMGGVFTQQNLAVMSAQLGRQPSEAELYIGHFFGPYSAAKAITAAQSRPTANASDMFPAAARANRPIFFDRQGRARSIADVCAELAQRYQLARAETAGPVINAAAVAAKTALPAVSTSGDPAPTPAIRAVAFTDTAAAVPATQNTGLLASAKRDSASGLFHSFFQAGDRREAVAPAVSELWRARSADTGRIPAASKSLDLFRDPHPDLRRGFGGD
jgi:hypothetical protein